MNTTRIPIRWMAALIAAALFVGPASIKAQDTGIAGSSARRGHCAPRTGAVLRPDDDPRA